MKDKILEKLLTFITAALGLVAGLAWNEAIKGLIEFLFPLSRNSVPAKFAYAILITIFVVILTVYLSKFWGKEKNAK